ncbi:MAG: hypothetical protein AB8U82_00970 [Rickettsia endosymbiont of Haemaphysalis japonica]
MRARTDEEIAVILDWYCSRGVICHSRGSIVAWDTYVIPAKAGIQHKAR